MRAQDPSHFTATASRPLISEICGHFSNRISSLRSLGPLVSKSVFASSFVVTNRLDNYIVRYISYDIYMRTDWNQYSGGAHFTHTCHPGWRHVAKWRMRYAKRRFAQAFSAFSDNFRDGIREFMGSSNAKHPAWRPVE